MTQAEHIVVLKHHPENRWSAKMQCPRCGQVRYKRDWMPSQWRASSSTTYQFNCCKICSPDGFWSSSPELQEALSDLKTAMSVMRPHKDTWLACFRAWMTLPHRVRKDLSYQGGIRVQLGESRMSVHCGALDARVRADDSFQYHDPGNFIYALAMRLMWPEFGEGGYNQETIGDIFEGILALRLTCGEEWSCGCASAHAELESYLRQVARFGMLAKDRIWACTTLGDCCRVVVQVLTQDMLVIS